MGFGLLAALYACTAAVHNAAPVEPPGLPVWPAAGAPLTVLTPASAGPVEVLLDAGHGAQGNTGNIGVRCQREQDVTKRIADGVLGRWSGIAGLTAETTRPDERPVEYDTRIARADQWADVMISLHTDARAGIDLHLDPTTRCRATTGAAGFSVLWSDEGLVAPARKRWAVAIATRLREAGFPAYDGADYTVLYEGDPANAGVFVDRHVPGQRIKILRRTTTPTVIVETHQALDADEVARWDEERTLDAFAAALAAAIGDVAAAPAP